MRGSCLATVLGDVLSAAPLVGLVGDGLLVELGLEVLERQRVVEDLHVVGLERFVVEIAASALESNAPNMPLPTIRPPPASPPLEEVAAVQAGCLGGFAEGAVGVDPCPA